MTNELRLIEPIEDLEEEYKSMITEWHNTREPLIPFVLKYDHSDFKRLINYIKGFPLGFSMGDFVPHSTYWLVNNMNEILGVSNLRHRLTPALLNDGGHIGYGIKPSQRGKGYANEILRLTLIKAKEKGISQVMLSCDKLNTASSKTIINNGGKLWKEHVVDGELTCNYWIWQ